MKDALVVIPIQSVAINRRFASRRIRLDAGRVAEHSLGHAKPYESGVLNTTDTEGFVPSWKR